MPSHILTNNNQCSPQAQPLTLQSRHPTTTKVSFSNVEIREYDRCLGNNPTSYHDGPSLSIDWNYKCRPAITLDEYEQIKDKKYHTQVMLHQKSLTCSSKNIQSLSGPIRYRIIRDHTQCTDDEIQSNIQESHQADRQRQLCLENQDFEVFHIVMESAQRKLGRFGQRVMMRVQKGRTRKQRQGKPRWSRRNQICPVDCKTGIKK